MYITIKSLNKTLGKYVEVTDLYIGVPMLFIFLFLFCLTNLKLESLIFLTICIFLMLPVQMSKKNRMYKIMGLFFNYIFKCKEYTYFKNEIGGMINEEK
jgi:hypothetical protein